jgi:hypothetical protein
MTDFHLVNRALCETAKVKENASFGKEFVMNVMRMTDVRHAASEGPFPRRQNPLGRAFCLPAISPGQRAEGKRDGKNIERARRRQLSKGSMVQWSNA